MSGGGVVGNYITILFRSIVRSESNKFSSNLNFQL